MTAATDETATINGMAFAVVALMALGIIGLLVLRKHGPTGPDDACDPVPTKATTVPAANNWVRVTGMGYAVDVAGTPNVDTPDHFDNLVGYVNVSDCKGAPHRSVAQAVYKKELKAEVKDEGGEKLVDVKNIVRNGHPGVSWHIRTDPTPATKDVGATPAVDVYGLSIVAHHRNYSIQCSVSGPINIDACNRYLNSFTIV